MNSLERIIYLDILLALNLFVNYFILLSVAKFLYLKIKRLKLILGALVGAVFSLYIFLPEQSLVFSLFIKILMAIIIIGSSFGFKNPKFLKKSIIEELLIKVDLVKAFPLQVSLFAIQ